MEKIAVTILFFLTVTLSLAQSKSGELRMERSFWGGTKFIQGERIYNQREMQNVVLKDNPDALAEFKKARTNYNVSQGIGFVAGFMIGWPIGTSIAGGEPEWGLAIAGGGLILVSIPFQSAFVKRAKSAITIYNGTSASTRPISLSIIPYGAGAKLVLKL